MQYLVQLGVLANDFRDQESSLEKDEGVTNAQIMFFLENGRYIEGKEVMPPRPVIQWTIDYFKTYELDKAIDKMLNVYLSTGKLESLEIEIGRFCERMSLHAQEMIYSNDGRLPANKPSTIKRKGFNHPLFVTGQLARSITCIFKKIS